FASVRLRRGADQLLAAWSEARSHAIVTGQTYQFVFVPESGDYRIEPWYADSPMLTSQASYATAGSGPPPIADDTTSYGSTTTGDGARSDWSDTASLPENITFHSGDIMEKLPDVGRELLPAAAGTPGWSKPVLFFPDGSSSAATLT